ncbi:MAG: DsbA family protein [Gammaproteobacteria bacterium]|nr:DsbA family protein [Gammaproteobacteria bacterium]
MSLNSSPNSSQAVLWYFADPMCSWCWGFSPVITAIKQDFADKLKLALTMGGLRPDETQAMSPSLRDDILHHWQEVARLTGQSFNFDNAMPEGFIYNTEPASRAVITMAMRKPELTMDYLKNIQSAFYTENIDVTLTDNLLRLVEQTGLKDLEFERIFNSTELKEQTHLHFQRSREFGVRGFPTLILQNDSGDHVLTRGYKSYTELKKEIETLVV